jgi:hypothetical protein
MFTAQTWLAVTVLEIERGRLSNNLILIDITLHTIKQFLRRLRILYVDSICQQSFFKNLRSYVKVVI